MRKEVDFALWLNRQRIREAHYMCRTELEEMFEIYTQYVESEIYKNN